MKKKTTQKKHRVASWLMALGIGVGAAAGVGGMVACAPGETNVPDNTTTYTQQMEDLQNKIDDLEQQIADLQDENSQQKQALQSQVNKLQLQYAYASTFANYVGLDFEAVNGGTTNYTTVSYAPNGEFTMSNEDECAASYDGLLFYKNGNKETIVTINKNDVVTDYAKLIAEQIASADVVSVADSNATMHTSYTCSSSKNDLSITIDLNDDDTFNNVQFNQNEIIFNKQSKAEYESENSSNGSKIKAYNQYKNFVNGVDELAKNKYIITDFSNDSSDYHAKGQYALSSDAIAYKSTDGSLPHYAISDGSGYRQLDDGDLSETEDHLTKDFLFDSVKGYIKDNEIKHITMHYNAENNEYTFELDQIYNNKTILTFQMKDDGITFVEKFTPSNPDFHSYVKTSVIKPATKQEFNEIYNEVNNAIEDFISAQKGNSL